MTFQKALSVIITLLIVGVSAAQDKRTRLNTKPINMSRLTSSKVIGTFGRPLGEVVSIEGIAADENYTRRKADTGQTLLRVLAVNGKTLKHEAILPFHPYEGVEVKKPSVGVRFKYVGYETGGFSGTPEAAFIYVPRVATSGYYFTTSFVILRDDSDGE